MKWVAICESLPMRHYEITFDPKVGYYFYVFDGERCVRDYLQDTFEDALDFAEQYYSIRKDNWRIRE